MNEIDPDASTPLLAHVEYWNNRMLYEAIYEGLRLRPSDSADATLRRAPSEDAEAA